MEKKRKQHQLEISIEKTLYILIRLDPMTEIEQIKLHTDQLKGCVDTYYRRYRLRDDEQKNNKKNGRLERNIRYE